jgi:hypothetical protein
MAARLATMMFSCYRASEASDPDMFIRSAAAILANYPQDISSAVANPAAGLPSRSKWLPSVAEVRAECDRLMAPRYEEEARRARRRHTESVLASPPLRRIDKGRFDELSAAMEAKEDFNGNPKPFIRSPEELAKEYAARPVKLSENAIKAFFAPKESDHGQD